MFVLRCWVCLDPTVIKKPDLLLVFCVFRGILSNKLKQLIGFSDEKLRVLQGQK